VKIILDDLTGPDIAAFLADHVRRMRSLTPVENAYALDLDGLRRPDITFWSVVDGTALVGCGALKELGPDHGEIKSMRTSPTRTRAGIASLLLDHLIAEARSRSYTRLSLETGTGDAFLPARRLYEKFGFELAGRGTQVSPNQIDLKGAVLNVAVPGEAHSITNC
jgi:putative acetyltransferase